MIEASKCNTIASEMREKIAPIFLNVDPYISYAVIEEMVISLLNFIAKKEGKSLIQVTDEFVQRLYFETKDI